MTHSAVAEAVGDLQLRPPTPDRDGWTATSPQLGPIPGRYATRDAALVAYGVALDGENAFDLDTVSSAIELAGTGPITVADLETARSAYEQHHDLAESCDR